LEKQYVRALFNAIAFRYDLLNHLLSGGADLYWRRRAVEHMRKLQPRRILDVATGTADLAIAALRLGPLEVIGVDIAEEMLKRGREKLEKRGLGGTISLRHGEAEHLEFAEGRFDAAMVAFGARNFENLDLGISEMHRVLRPGGMVLVLEFSRPRLFPFKQIYLFYFKRILPLVGRSLSRHGHAYTYLPETVLRFPEGADFLTLLGRAGFTGAAEDRLTLGIATVYTGIKPASPAAAGVSPSPGGP
jgi:demethylmenaquinone methyltransferase/2-methoxy-6-polyprenyl-1,4-benzoquinol methylase